MLYVFYYHKIFDAIERKHYLMGNGIEENEEKISKWNCFGIKDIWVRTGAR